MIRDAEKIYTGAIKACLPDATVREALRGFTLPKGRLILVAIGKAAWKMADCAYKILGEKIHSGIVITKYEHSEGKIGNLEIYEAAHPVPDKNGILADVAPTVLKLMGLEQPKEMTGEALVEMK